MTGETAARRVQGVHWQVTEDFLDRLSALLDEDDVTSGSLARELSDAMGQEVDESSIRALKRAKPDDRGSVLVGPLCVLKGWPVPPLAKVAGEWSVAAAELYELMGADPVATRAIVKAVRDRVISLRKVRDLNSK